MRVRMKPGYWPDLPRMQQTIKKAGYTPIPEGTELRVSGKVVKLGDRLTVELDGMKAPVALPVTAAKDDPETAAHLGRHVGETVELEGNWQPPADGQQGIGALAVTAIYGAEDKKNRS